MCEKVFQCDKCGRDAEKIVRGMCPKCYHRVWVASDAGQNARRRNAEWRKNKLASRTGRRTAEQVAAGEPKGRLGAKVTNCSTAWYGCESKVPPDTQRRIFELYSEGHEPADITRILNESLAPAGKQKFQGSVVRQIISRGVLSPKYVKEYRCGGCGNKVCASPCFICESRRVHSNSRGLAKLVG